jgi:hypothetical protein
MKGTIPPFQNGDSRVKLRFGGDERGKEADHIPLRSAIYKDEAVSQAEIEDLVACSPIRCAAFGDELDADHQSDTPHISFLYDCSMFPWFTIDLAELD